MNLTEILIASSLISSVEGRVSDYNSIIIPPETYATSYNLSITDNYKTKTDLIKEEILKLVDVAIGLNVYNSSIDLIEKLSYSVISQFDIDNLYATDYGTLILDWERNDRQFSLEIGGSNFGYYIDNNSEYKLKENLIFNTIDTLNLYSDLDSFLS